MQVLKVDSEITVLYKTIITVSLSKYTFSLIAPLIFCVLNKHHFSHFYTAPEESRKEVNFHPRLLTTLGFSLFHPFLPRLQMSFTFAP